MRRGVPDEFPAFSWIERVVLVPWPGPGAAPARTITSATSQRRHGGTDEKCTNLRTASMKWNEVMARFGERYEPAFFATGLSHNLPGGLRL
jgi:hypothetical protein